MICINFSNHLPRYIIFISKESIEPSVISRSQYEFYDEVAMDLPCECEDILHWSRKFKYSDIHFIY